ncbi:MAG: helix-turn-helix transcriptional regulator [Ferruginibacter sp.]
MKSATRIRNQLGMTQTQMAQLLSVSRSLFAMYERNTRDLPIEALSILASIELFITSPRSKKSAMHPLLLAQQQKTNLVLEKFAKDQAYRQAVAERKLSKAKQLFDRKMLLLSLLDHLDAGIANALAKSVPRPFWLTSLKKSTVKKIGENGLDKQALLKAQISAYGSL